MRSPLVLVLVLAAAAAGYLLLAGGEESVYEPRPLEEIGDAESTLLPTNDAPGRPRRSPEGTRPAAAKRRAPVVVDPRTVPRGRIDVRPVGPDGRPVASKTLRVSVEPTGRPDWVSRLGQVDPETGVWSFPKTLAGEVLVHVYGDFVSDARQKAVVEANDTTQVTVRLQPAGAIRYEVELSDRTRPKEVILTLLDEAGQPVEAWYEVRAGRASGKPRRARRIKQGPQGVLFGLAPGRYRLRAALERGEGYELPVVVLAGEAQAVSFELRR